MIIRRLFALLMLFTTVASVTVVANTPEVLEDKGNISGIVTDVNGEPLASASVWIDGTTIGVNTNSKGVFVLNVKELSACTLKVSLVGYTPVSRKVYPNSDEALNLRITLQQAVNELDEVVVTGSGMGKPLKEVPVLTRIISAKDIETLNPMNIEKLLTFEVPGLQIGYNRRSQLPTIKYQGAEGDYVLFLIDGERIGGEGADHNVDFSRFNVDDIERIEVVKGSQSTIYGSNALGGVINIITKKTNRPLAANLYANYSMHEGGKYTLSGGMKRNRLSTFTSLTMRHRGSFVIEDKAGEKVTVYDPKTGTNTEEQEEVAHEAVINGYKIWNATQKVSYAINDKLKADAKGSFYYNKNDIRPWKKFHDIFVDYTMSGKLTFLPNATGQWTTSYLLDHYTKDKFFVETNRNRTDFVNQLHEVRTDYLDVWGDHHIGIGGTLLHEYLKHYMLKDSTDAQITTYALYLQDEWKLTEQLSLTAGLRADYNSKYRWHVTPKLSMMYRPLDYLTLRAGYSQGFRAPTLKELYQAYDMGGFGWFILYGNENLKPETSHQYALSAETSLGALNASVSAYYNQFYDRIAYQPMNNGTNDKQYVNADKARSLGIETIARYRLPIGLTLTVAYAYINEYQEMEGRNTSTARPHSVTFGGLYSRMFGRVKGSMAINGQWVSALTTNVYTKENTFRQYSYDPRMLCALNLSAQWPNGINLMLGVENLFNHRDKAAESFLQIPQRGIALVGAVKINIGDFLGW